MRLLAYLCTDYLVVIKIAERRCVRHLLGTLLLFVTGAILVSSARSQVSLTDQDIEDTAQAFRTDDVDREAELFRKKLSLMGRPSREVRKMALQKIKKEFGKIRNKDKELLKVTRKRIKPVLEFFERERYYALFLINHSSPFILNQSGAVLVISTGLLSEANNEELLGFVAHEIGHDYFGEYSRYTEHLYLTVKKNGGEEALLRQYAKAMAIIELQCDAFASIVLTRLGYKANVFVRFADRMSKKYPVDPESFHPKTSDRIKVVRKLHLKQSPNETQKT